MGQNFPQSHFNTSLFSQACLSPELPDTLSPQPPPPQPLNPVGSSLHPHSVPSAKEKLVVNQACPPSPWLSGPQPPFMRTFHALPLFPVSCFVYSGPSFSTQIFVGRDCVFILLCGPCCFVPLVLNRHLCLLHSSFPAWLWFLDGGLLFKHGLCHRKGQ